VFFYATNTTNKIKIMYSARVSSNLDKQSKSIILLKNGASDTIKNFRLVHVYLSLSTIYVINSVYNLIYNKKFGIIYRSCPITKI